MNIKKIMLYCMFIAMTIVPLNRVVSAKSLGVLKANDTNFHTELNRGECEELFTPIEKATPLSLDEFIKENAVVDGGEKEKEKTIYEIAGDKYDIDPYLLEAIERLESGNYTSDLCVYYNNTWGAYANGEFLSFPSREDSTMELARVLRVYYFDKGLTTLEEIGSVYCPDSETWASKVKEIYNEIKY